MAAVPPSLSSLLTPHTLQYPHRTQYNQSRNLQPSIKLPYPSRPRKQKPTVSTTPNDAFQIRSQTTRESVRSPKFQNNLKGYLLSEAAGNLEGCNIQPAYRSSSNTRGDGSIVGADSDVEQYFKGFSGEGGR